MKKVYTIIHVKDNLPAFVETINSMVNKDGAELLGGISVVAGSLGQREFYQAMYINAEAHSQAQPQGKHQGKK